MNASLREAVVAALLGAALGCSPAAPPGAATAGTREVRERAYRANNVGVALLEQLKYPEAAAAFREALALDGTLGLAHFNLSLALLYAQDLDGAQREAELAAAQLPDAPQPPYVLGLIARSQGRSDVARTRFDRVRQLMPADVGAAINVAQIALEEQRYADAVAVLRPVVEAEPANVTAAYVLGLALTRSGAGDEGQRLLGRVQALRGSGYAVTFGTGYLEQGSLAEAIASTGREPELVLPVSSRVRLAPSPLAGEPADAGAPAGSAAGVTGALAVLDLEGDGDLDLIAVDETGVRLRRNDRGSWSDATAGSGLGVSPGPGVTVAVAADVDNDGAADLLLGAGARPRLYRNDGAGRFADVSDRAGLPSMASVAAAAFADLDHDGDVDLVLASDGAVRLLRNNRDGSFTDVTREARIAPVRAPVAIIPTDYDNHRDVDLLFVGRSGAPALYANQRDGTFREVTAAAGLDAIVAAGVEVFGAAVGDLNKDDAPDFVLATSAGVVAATSDGRGRFGRQVIDDRAALTAVQVFDYDNDGLLDVLGWTSGGLQVWRNEGRGWRAVPSAVAGEGRNAAPVSPRAAAAADFDNDGDTDAVALTPGGLSAWWNSGDPERHGLRVSPVGLVSNKAGIGAKIQLRAGSLSSRVELSAASPPVAPADAVFGLGPRDGADVVRVLWPSGILQAEVAEAPPPAGSAGAPAGGAGARPSGAGAIRTALRVEELDRKPSSCPFLFAWNGERFEFVTDFLGAGEMGSWTAPGTYNRSDPTEYVRLAASQLRPRDGRLELRVTNELEETLFLDQVQLVAVDHPSAMAVFPNEGMADPPKPHRLHAVRDVRVPARVVDDRGLDVTALVAERDWRAPDGFPVMAIRGYAVPHALVIDLGGLGDPGDRGDSRDRRRPVLLLTGWTDYAFSSDNVAAHQAGLVAEPPALAARAAGGRWRGLDVAVGVPVGRPQTIALDLTGVLRPGERELRLSTGMRVYWDQIAVGDAVATDGVTTRRLDVGTAVLRERGFSSELRAAAPGPLLYDYGRVTFQSPWKSMAGRFTRPGDVRPLLTDADDRFVIARPGDEVALDFPADALPSLPEGWTRTYLLRADGFSKEMDPNSASPYAVGPLPFHRMTRYPYGAGERYPDSPAHDAYQAQYNTRVVVRPLPTLAGPSRTSPESAGRARE